MKIITSGRGRLPAWLAFIACTLLCTPAIAQTSRSYSVLSLVADRITLVFARPGTGSHVDQHLREVYALPDDSLDIVAVQAAEAALKRIDAQSSIELYSTRDPKLYTLQDAQADGDHTTPAVVNSLNALLAQSKATHLILITKHRADASFPIATGTVGAGRVSGIGFYVDGAQRLINVDTGHTGLGFVSPYAYLKLELIDVSPAQNPAAGRVHAVRARRRRPLDRRLGMGCDDEHREGAAAPGRDPPRRCRRHAAAAVATVNTRARGAQRRRMHLT